MDNPEKGIHKMKKTKQKHNTIFVGHHYAKTNTKNVNKTWVLLLETKTNRTPFLCGNRIEQYNGELRT